jgi:hypothetical protein
MDSRLGSPRHQIAVLIDISVDDDLSGVIDLGPWRIAALHMPGTLTSTAIAIHAAEAGDGTFNPLVSSDGTAVSLTVAASQVVAVNQDAGGALAACRFIKLAMGSSEAADRTINLLLTQ